MRQLPQDYLFRNKKNRAVYTIQPRIGSRHYLKVFTLPALLLTLNVLDIISTQYGLTIGLREINPLFSNAIIPGKFLGCTVLYFSSFFANRLDSKVKTCVDGILCCVIIFYVLVLANNILLIAMPWKMFCAHDRLSWRKPTGSTVLIDWLC